MIVSPRICSSTVRGMCAIQLEVFNMLCANSERSAAQEQKLRLSLL